MGQQVDVLDLPFVSRRRRNKARARRLFWNIKPTGDYAEDLETGRRMALE